MAQIMNLLNQCISAASEWFVSVFTASGMIEVYISFLFVVFAIRFLLAPVFGSSRGSDKARRSGEGDSNE